VKKGLALCFVLGFAASVRAQTISEITLSSPTSGPGPIVQGPDGNVWFTERQVNKIGMVPSGGGSVTEYAVPPVTGGGLNLRLQSLAAGDGVLWYLMTEGGSGAVGKITTSGTATVVSPVIPDRLFGITVRSDGIWFTGVNNGAMTIRKMTTDGVVTAYPVPTTVSAAAPAHGIITGPDGNLWFTEPSANKIGTITPSGVIHEYAAGAGSGPLAIASGPDGALWFTEPMSNKIGRMTTDGTLTGEFAVPTSGVYEQDITVGSDGNLWFTESSATTNKIGRITPGSSTVSELLVPTAASTVFGVAAAGGNIWFTETTAGKLGYFAVGSAPTPTPTPTTSPTPTPTPTPGNGPNLQISKTDDGRPWIDSQGTINYTVAYSNTGNATAHNVRLTEHPDPQENFYGGGGFDSSGVMEIGDLAAGATGTASFSMNVALDPADPYSPPYEVHNEVEIQGDAQGSSSPGVTSALTKQGSDPLDSVGADITHACSDPVLCSCPINDILRTLQTQLKRATTFVKSAAQDVLLYYRVRDRVLAQSPGGRRYISLYYRHASEITGLLAGDASLRSLAVTAMDSWAPGLQALVDGAGSGLPVTQPMADSMTALLESLKQKGSADLHSDIESEQAALDLSSLVGVPMDQASRKVDQRPCEAGDDHLCLNGGRFRVDVAWKVPEQSKSGVGTAVSLTGDTGYFWFFNSANVELVVKVLDASSVNGKFWVFYGALSDVAYTITVTDTHTGAVRTYANLDHNLASFADTSAFASSERAPTLEARSAEVGAEEGVGGLSKTELYALYAARTQVEARPKGAAPCATGGATLCLNSNRFQVTVDWSVPSQSRSGVGTAAAVTGDTGYMWFFSPNNVELIIKVLDGRAINGHFWVFYGALSDVQYKVTVKDTQTGAVQTYDNPSGTQASHADTTAF